MTTKVNTSTLADSGVIAGTYGSSSTIPVITVDSTGRIVTATATSASGGSSGVGVTTFIRTTQTANSNQSVFTANYIPGFAQVFMNGILLHPSDFAAQTGNTVTLLANARSGDIVDVIAYFVTSVGNLTGGAPGTVTYQPAANTTGFTAVGNTGQVLLSGGAGSPTWGSLSNSAVGLAYTSNVQFLSIGVGKSASGNTGDFLATTGTFSGALAANSGTISTGLSSQSLGVGTTASGTAGEIRATNDITAFYSSDRSLKENVQPIENAVDKAVAIGGKTFDWINSFIEDRGGEDGYFMVKSDLGVIAQDVEAVLPQAVRTRANGIKVVDYPKLAALALQAIVELSSRVEALEKKAKIK